jgi:phytoene synthase
MTTAASTRLAPASLSVPSLEAAYGECLRLVRDHYENFPVASLWLPPLQRRSVAAVYAFARVADDFADEPVWAADERLNLLADWRARLRACRADHARHPVFWAVADTLERFALPLDPFERLVTAFERDVTVRRHPRFEDVLDYCRHSANPVGELVLRISGEWTPRRGAWSDDICTALQLANFWQDVAVDAKKDRLYVPLEDLKAAGVTEAECLEGPADGRLADLLRRQVERTEELFRRGRPLCDDVPPRLRRELRLVWLGGMRILEKVRARGFDSWSGRPSLGAGDWARLLWRWLRWRPG